MHKTTKPDAKKKKKQLDKVSGQQFNKNTSKQLKQKQENYSKYFLPSILIITAIVFANSLYNGFVDNWDDNVYILNNEIIKQLSWDSLKEIFSTFCAGNYHPLTVLSYAIEYKFFGSNPLAYHLTNYFLHLLNVALVYFFLKRFTNNIWVAAIASVFFAVHPMHVESVAWISERKDLLYTAFFLLALISYSKYLMVEKKISYLIWTFFWFFLSLMSKSAAVCLPLVLVLMDYYHNKSFTWRSLFTKIPYFVLALLFGIIAIYSQKADQSIQTISPLFNFIDRIFIVIYSAVYYLFKVFAPFNLSALHYYPIKSGNMLPIEYYLALPILLLLVWGVFKSGKFKRELVFGLLLYLSTILLVIQIIPVGHLIIVSERYSYVPYIGIFFIFGQFFSYNKDKLFSYSNKLKSIIPVLLILFLVMFSYLTYERNKVWKSGIVLFTDVIEKYPKQGHAWYARGNSKNEKGDFDGAIIDYNKVIELNPKYGEAYFNRGIVFGKMGNFEGAIADYTKTIELQPSTFTAAYMNRGIAFDQIGQYNKAIFDYSHVISINPKLFNAYYNRGIVYDKLGKFENAIADYSKAIELDSKFIQGYFNRGSTYDKIQKFDNAIADYNKAIELNPNYVEAYLNRGNVFDEVGKTVNAISDYSSAIQLKPDYPDLYYNRGNSYFKIGKFDSAVADFNKAIELNPNFIGAYFNRAYTKLQLKDLKGACNDWQSAQNLGDTKATEMLKMYCK